MGVRVKELATRLQSLCLAAALLATFTGPAMAASNISETFDGTSLPASLEFSSGPPATFPGGIALFSDGNRSYLRTIEDDYATVDFTAEITVTIPAGGPAQTAFFGLGVGDRNPAQFNAPTVIPNIYAEAANEGFANAFFRANDNGIDQPLVRPAAGAGTHRLQLVWDATSGTATLSIHRYYTGGPFVASTTVTADGSDNGFTPANARVFFGSGAGTSFDDFTFVIADDDGDGVANNLDNCPDDANGT